jgi:hypothetical protein
LRRPRPRLRAAGSRLTDAAAGRFGMAITKAVASPIAISRYLAARASSLARSRFAGALGSRGEIDRGGKMGRALRSWLLPEPQHARRRRVLGLQPGLGRPGAVGVQMRSGGKNSRTALSNRSHAWSNRVSGIRMRILKIRDQRPARKPKIA